MLQSLVQDAPRVRDTYSVAEALRHCDRWLFLAVLRALCDQAPPEALSAHRLASYPRVAEVDPDAHDVDLCLHYCIWPEAATMPTRGQPSRLSPPRAFVAIQVAAAIDLYGDPCEEVLEEHLERFLERRRGMPRKLALTDGCSATLGRWIRDGRTASRQLGDFPWAVPGGSLRGRWWQRDPYAIALHDWAGHYGLSIPQSLAYRIAHGLSPRRAPSPPRCVAMPPPELPLHVVAELAATIPDDVAYSAVYRQLKADEIDRRSNTRTGAQRHSRQRWGTATRTARRPPGATRLG